MSKGEIEELKRRLMEKRNKPQVKINGLSTGSTLLNLACSNKPHWGIAPGNYYFLVGDSASGKSWLSLTLLAEASINSRFDDYRFVFDNAENGVLMDIAHYFGKSTADRIEAPLGGKESPVYSSTVEEFYENVDTIAKEGKPFIYILDSMDALTSEDEQEQFDKEKQARMRGKDTSGSYGTSKAKKNSSGMRLVFNHLRKTNSILVVISQTRDNIGFGSQFNPKTRSGGRALTFYACLEFWTSVAGHIKSTVKGKPRELGIICKIRIKKNRLTGKDRSVEIPIYHSAGVDDLGSCIRYLISEGHWKGSENKVNAPEFDYSGSIEGLISNLEEGNREKELRRLVARVWDEIEEACSVNRKRRYP